MRNVPVLLAAGLLACGVAFTKEPPLDIALTFDDLPLNGSLQPGVKQSELARDTVKVLVRAAPTGVVGSVVRQALGSVQFGISDPFKPQNDVDLTT